jgi:ribosomal protein S18 acetylase RimI-like enzyme
MAVLQQPPSACASSPWRLRRATATDHPGVVALSQALGTGYPTAQSVAEACSPPWARLWVGERGPIKSSCAGSPLAPNLGPAAPGLPDCPGRPDWRAELPIHPHSYLLFWVVPPELEIHDLAVAPSLQRHGGGRALVAALLEGARSAGIERLFLEVRQSNAAARALYAAMGFVYSGRRAAYYADTGEDALCLTRALQPSPKLSDTSSPLHSSGAGP